MKRAVVYCRISDDRAGTGLGVARQEEDGRALCERSGWSVAEVLIDNDRSAYSGKPRPAYERLLAGLQEGSWDVVVAWHPDRLHRSPKELERFIDIVEASKASVATVTAGIYDLSTATGRMTARVVGAVARMSSEQQAERTIRKHRQLAEAGRPTGGGTRPFGYLPDRVTIDPGEAERVREAAADILAGLSLRSIVTNWTHQDVPTVTGRPWATFTLRRLLTAPRTAGYRQHGGKLHKGTWEPLLDEVTWKRVRAVLLDPARRVNHSPRTYLLTGGLARCSLCTMPLIARPKSDGRRCYVCASGPGFNGCGKIRVLAEPLERDVRDRAAARISAGPLPQVEGEGEAPGLLAAIDQDEAALAELSNDYYVHRTTPKVQFQQASAALTARIEANRSAAARLVRTAPLDADAVAVLAQDDPTPRQRAVIEHMADQVLVGPAVKGRNFYDRDRVNVDWR